MKLFLEKYIQLLSMCEWTETPSVFQWFISTVDGKIIGSLRFASLPLCCHCLFMEEGGSLVIQCDIVNVYTRILLFDKN